MKCAWHKLIAWVGLVYVCIHNSVIFGAPHATLGYLMVIVQVLAFAFLFFMQRMERAKTALSTACIVVLPLWLSLVSQASLDGRSYFKDWFSDPWGHWFWTGVLPASFFMFILFRWRPIWGRALALLTTIIASSIGLWRHTGGAPIYRDDHPAFWYRLQAWGETFPQQLFYDVFWNGGEKSSVLVASGINGVGLPLWPLWRFVEGLYAVIPGFIVLFIIGVPLIGVGAARLFCLGWRVALTVGMLCTLVGVQYGIFQVQYGTWGFAFAMPMSLLICGVVYRVLWLDDMRLRWAVVLIGASWVLLSWPPAGLFMLPLGIGALFAGRRWTGAKFRFFGWSALVLSILYWPLLEVILFHAKPVVTGQLELPRTRTLEALWEKGWETIQLNSAMANPLILFAGVGGLLTMRRSGLRGFLMPFVVVGVLTACFLTYLFPQLSLRRMFMLVLFLMALPAARMIDFWLRQRGRGWWVIQVPLVALLGATLWSSFSLYAGFGKSSYFSLPDSVVALVDEVERVTPSGTRFMFAGGVGEAYGGGHINALPLLRGREMMSCDPHAISPLLVEWDYPPARFQERIEDVLWFLDTYNVGGIITYRRHWMNTFFKYQDWFPIVGEHEGKNIYQPPVVPNPFWLGQGRVSDLRFNEIRLELEPGQNMVVVKYNWVPGLRAEGAFLFPVDVGFDVQLIGLWPEQERVRIRF